MENKLARKIEPKCMAMDERAEDWTCHAKPTHIVVFNYGDGDMENGPTEPDLYHATMCKPHADEAVATKYGELGAYISVFAKPGSAVEIMHVWSENAIDDSVEYAPRTECSAWDAYFRSGTGHIS